MTLPLRTAAFWQDPYPLLDEARGHGRIAVGESGEPVTLAIDDLEVVSGHPLMAPLGLDALDRLGITDGPFREWRRLSLNAQPGDDHRPQHVHPQPLTLRRQSDRPRRRRWRAFSLNT